MQRKCLRCGNIMKECQLSPDSNAYGLKITKVSPVMQNGLKVKAAVCEACGEISLYAEGDIKKILE